MPLTLEDLEARLRRVEDQLSKAKLVSWILGLALAGVTGYTYWQLPGIAAEAARKSLTETTVKQAEGQAQQAAASAKVAEQDAMAAAARIKALEGTLGTRVAKVEQRVGEMGARYGECWWQEIGYDKTHGLGGAWIQENKQGAFLVELDLDGFPSGMSPVQNAPALANYPIVGKARYCRP